MFEMLAFSRSRITVRHFVSLTQVLEKNRMENSLDDKEVYFVQLQCFLECTGNANNFRSLPSVSIAYSFPMLESLFLRQLTCKLASTIWDSKPKAVGQMFPQNSFRKFSSLVTIFVFHFSNLCKLWKSSTSRNHSTVFSFFISSARQRKYEVRIKCVRLYSAVDGLQVFKFA